MIKKRGIWIVWALFLIISFYFDSEIVKGISLLRNSLSDEFFLGITFVSSEVIIFFFLTSLFLFKENKRKLILPLWITLLFSAIISFLLKILFHRPRPFQLGIVETLSVLEKTSQLVWNFSFPSFQSVLVFCSIPILSRAFPKFKNFWIGFACLVAFSRIYFGVHFLSDVFVGGILGYFIGHFILKFEDKNKFLEKGYNKIFNK